MRSIKIFSLGILLVSATAISGEVKEWKFFQPTQIKRDLGAGIAPGAAGVEIAIQSDLSAYACVTVIGNQPADCGKTIAHKCYPISKAPDFEIKKISSISTVQKGHLNSFDLFDKENKQLCQVVVTGSNEAAGKMDGYCYYVEMDCLNLNTSSLPIVSGTR